MSSSSAQLLRDFVNTYDVESGDDAIAAPADLTAWLGERDLVPPDARANPGDLYLATTLREGLRAAMIAHHDPEPADLSAGLGPALGQLPLLVAVAPERPVLVPAGDGVRAGLARVVVAIIDSVADGTWARLKVCQDSTCRWAFLDTSKNRSRAWCSMRVCGNRTKTRAYRARRREAAD